MDDYGRRWATYGLAALSLTGLLAGCGSGSSDAASSSDTSTTATGAPAAGQSPAPKALTDAQLKPLLLGVSALPTGWRTSPVDTSSSQGGITCATKEPKKTHVGDVEADFANSSVETISERLDSYPGSAAAASSFTASIAYLTSCSSAHAGGVQLAISLLSLPTAGDQSAAFQLTGTIQGFNVAIDVDYSRRGANIVTLIHSDIVPIDSQLTGSTTSKAVAKLAG